MRHDNSSSYPYDYLIVGAGLYGALFAYLAGERGARCLVVDKRPVAGGNLYCEKTEGINVHAYGPHIFHTSDKQVWDFVTSLVPFNGFVNSPIAVAPDGHSYNLPFNMNTFAQLWGINTPEEAQSIIASQRAEAAEKMKQEGVATPRNLEEQALLLVGKDIFNLLIKGYTEKQWGRSCSKLPAFIIKRLPVRFIYDNNYFNDAYQGIPIGGYNPLIAKLLQKATVMTSTDYLANRSELRPKARTLVFTGPVDEYFDCQFGGLDYRSLRFQTETMQIPNYQGNAVVNFTSRDVAFTRSIEHKHFEASGEDVYLNPSTVVTREFPAEWQPGMERYYPVNDPKNAALYAKYKELADSETNTIFGGRLAEYKYYDMAPIVRELLTRFSNL